MSPNQAEEYFKLVNNAHKAKKGENTGSIFLILETMIIIIIVI